MREGCFCQYLVIIKTNEARGREKTQIVMFLELLLLTISLLMANRFHATNADILQVMLFFGLIYFATAYETLLNHICNNSKIVAFGGKFCLPVYVSHIFLISLPLKYYPQTWEKRYIAYLILVIGISSIDYTIAQLGQYLVRKLSDRRKQATTAKNIS